MKSKIEKIITVPESKGFYIAGFADGEGSFNVSFKKRDTHLIGWKMTPVFNISQKERVILAIIKHYMGCGTIRFRSDHVWVYEVENQRSLRDTVIPFFKRFPFLSQKKKKDFARFQKVVQLQDAQNTPTYQTIEEVLTLLQEVESKRSRKYTDDEIKERALLFWKKNREKIEILNSSNNKVQDLAPQLFFPPREKTNTTFS